MSDHELTKDDIQFIRDELESGTVAGHWRIGWRLRAKAGDRAPALACWVVQLKGVCGRGSLQQCLRLARRWDEPLAQQADEADLSYFQVISLLVLDGIADRGPSDRADKARKERDRLLAILKGGTINRERLADEISRARQRFRGNASNAMRKVRLQQAEKRCLSLLKRLKGRLEKARKLWDPAGQNISARIARKVDELEGLVEQLFRPARPPKGSVGRRGDGSGRKAAPAPPRT